MVLAALVTVWFKWMQKSMCRNIWVSLPFPSWIIPHRIICYARGQQGFSESHLIILMTEDPVWCQWHHQMAESYSPHSLRSCLHCSKVTPICMGCHFCPNSFTPHSYSLHVAASKIMGDGLGVSKWLPPSFHPWGVFNPSKRVGVFFSARGGIFKHFHNAGKSDYDRKQKTI